MNDSKFREQLELGLAAHQQSRFDEALAAYRRALDELPGDAEALSLSGLALTHLGCLDEARAALQEAVEREPREAGFRINLIECLERSGDYEDALLEVDRVLAIDRQRPRAWEKKGDLYSRSGKLDDAAHAYQAGLEIDHQNAGLAVKLARTNARQREFAAAHRALDVANELAPNDPAIAEFRAAMLAEQLDWTNLERFARRWIDIAPENPAAWNSLTQATFERGQYRKALASFEKVIEISGRTATNLAAMGRICLYAFEFERAAAMLDEAEAENPNLVEMLSAKASLLAYQGQFDEALKYCRRCLHQDPGYVPAYTQLIRLTKGHLEEQEAKTLLSLGENESCPMENRVLAYFVLGHGFDAEGRYSDAFAAYDRGNALQSAQNSAEGITYDPGEAEARIDAIIELSPKVAVKSPRGSATPIFIVGMPRSGTTLVESVLAAHSTVVAGGERPIMPRLLDRYLALAGDEDVSPGGVEALARAYMDEVSIDDGFFTDKNPLNFESLGLIWSLFPNAIVIHVRRDPMEVGLSIFRHEFSKFWRFTHSLEHIGHFYRQYHRLMSHWERLFGDRIITIQYEEFASEFAAAARVLVARCGLEWEDACENYQQQPVTIATFSAVQARDPVTVRNGKALAYAEYLDAMREALGSVTE